MARINITIPDRIRDRAAMVAEDLGLSLSSFCVLAVSLISKPGEDGFFTVVKKASCPGRPEEKKPGGEKSVAYT